jgi:hypothetical protein
VWYWASALEENVRALTSFGGRRHPAGQAAFLAEYASNVHARARSRPAATMSRYLIDAPKPA